MLLWLLLPHVLKDCTPCRSLPAGKAAGSVTFAGQRRGPRSQKWELRRKNGACACKDCNREYTNFIRVSGGTCTFVERRPAWKLAAFWRIRVSCGQPDFHVQPQPNFLNLNEEGCPP